MSCALLGPFRILLHSIGKEDTFFLGEGGGGRAKASEGRVISELEHQRGRVTLLCRLFEVRVTHLFQDFLMRIFVMLLPIFLTD